jgi:hypothetical protein
MHRRSWLFSVLSALGLVGLIVLLAVVVNPMFGRYIHWDRVAVGAPVAVVVVAVALRRRWV